MNNKKQLSKNFWYLMLGICLFLIIVVAIGFGIFANRKPNVITKIENGGNVILNYTSDVNGLKLMNASPTTDEVGIKSMDDGDYFDFSVDTALDNAASIEYDIVIIKDTKNSTISNDDIRIYLEHEESGSYVKVFGPEKYEPTKEDTLSGIKAGSMVLYHVKKTKMETDHYRLRMWKSDKSVLPEGSFSVEVVVKGESK